MQWRLSALTESDIEQILLIEKMSFKQPWSSKLFHEELSSKDAFDYVVKLNSVGPETKFEHMQAFNSEISNFGQAQENQAIARRRTHSTSHKKSRRLTQRSPKRAISGEVIAYLCSRITGSEMSILRIAVLTKWRNSGIASWLLNRCFEIALTKGVTSVFLEVRESNNAATSLYGKLGFMPVGKRPNYYSETGEDALVFMKKLS